MYGNNRGLIAVMLSFTALFFGAVFKIAFKLRIGPALLYAFIVPFFFESWYDNNALLATAIFFVLAGVGVISWIVTFVGWLRRRA